jgi:hypothetical protein
MFSVLRVVCQTRQRVVQLSMTYVLPILLIVHTDDFIPILEDLRDLGLLQDFDPIWRTLR